MKLDEKMVKEEFLKNCTPYFSDIIKDLVKEPGSVSFGVQQCYAFVEGKVKQDEYIRRLTDAPVRDARQTFLQPDQRRQSFAPESHGNQGFSSGDPQRPCFNCGSPGHWKAQCPHLRRNIQKQGEQRGNSAVRSFSGSSSGSKDSKGDGRHTQPRRSSSRFDDRRPSPNHRGQPSKGVIRSDSPRGVAHTRSTASGGTWRPAPRRADTAHVRAVQGSESLTDPEAGIHPSDVITFAEAE